MKNGLIDSTIDITQFVSQLAYSIYRKQATVVESITTQLYEMERCNDFLVLVFEKLNSEMLVSQMASLEMQLLFLEWCAGSLGAILLLGLVVGWRRVYRKISEKASLANAFLLLMPYSVLKDNPYVRVYVKNEFNLGGSLLPV